MLAEHPPNRKVMLNEVGMLESLKKVKDGERFVMLPCMTYSIVF